MPGTLLSFLLLIGTLSSNGFFPNHLNMLDPRLLWINRGKALSWIDGNASKFRRILASSSIAAFSFVPGRSRTVAISPKHDVMFREENDHILNEMISVATVDTSRTKAPSIKSVVGTSFVRDAVRRVGPSVVRVDCEREVPLYLTSLNELFRDREGETIRVGGSGIIITSDGYILTNSHVVDSAKKVTISISTGRVYKCKVVAFDELTDLALLKAEMGSDSLKAAPLGDSSALFSGDWVIAMGSPVGLDWTVTLGIVSNPHRSAFEVGAPQMKGFFIQTDAALNSGNSGGPLVNEFGQVIGINTMVRSNTEAIGFAIPINQARQIYQVLRQGKKPSHAYFGMEVMTLTPDVARINNEDPNAQRLPEVHGALVTRVIPGSPAAAYGIRRHDIITTINGIVTANAEEADANLDSCTPGQFAKLKIARGDPKQNVDLDVAPQDLQALIDEKRKIMQSVIVVKPPQ